MSQNQENIEAQLCAYIDDELDAAGRAELEKHLAANPQYQRLIEELRRTSGLVRNLPRENAPTDLSEGFNAQIERSVLLQGVSEDVVAASLRTPRWPQLAAMAAITLLTAGLALVVYFSLPQTGARPKVQFAQTNPSFGGAQPPNVMDKTLALADGTQADQVKALAPATPAAAVESSRSADRAKSYDLNGSADNSPVGGETVGGETVGGTGSSTGGGSGALALSSAVNKNITEKKAIEADQTPVPDAAPLLVIHTDHPASVRRDLVLYLVQQNINWEPAGSDAPKVSLALRRSIALAGKGAAQNQPTGAVQSPPAPTFSVNRGMATVAASSIVDAGHVLGAINAEPATQPTTQNSTILPERDGQLAVVATANQDALAQNPRAQNNPTTSDLGYRQFSRSQLQSNGQEIASDFAVVAQLTPSQIESLRTTLQGPGTIIDPLPMPSPGQLASTAEKKVEAASPPSPVADGANQSADSQAESAATAVPKTATDFLARSSEAPATQPAPDDTPREVVIDVQQSEAVPGQSSPPPNAAPAVQSTPPQPAPPTLTTPAVIPATQPADPLLAPESHLGAPTTVPSTQP